ncbi:hypothetical protein [Aeromicrobium sp. 179-A 4D2 NHS]|uniref:hypothetical protein n=1 Tax=Aeromicrobium sp. 179-A 4D2 NHS TaxID=3142375 RepID=UPI0039A14BCA
MTARKDLNVKKGKQGFQPTAPKPEATSPMRIVVPEGPDTSSMPDQLLAKSVDDGLISIDAALGVAHAGDKTTAKAVQMLTEDDFSWADHEQGIAEMVANHPASSDETLRKLADDRRLDARTKGRIAARLNGVEAVDPVQTEADKVVAEQSGFSHRTLAKQREFITEKLGSGRRLTSNDYTTLMKREARAGIWTEIDNLVAERGVTYSEAARRARKMAVRKVLGQFPDSRSSNQLSNVMDDYQQAELLEFIRWSEDLEDDGTVG